MTLSQSAKKLEAIFKCFSVRDCVEFFATNNVINDQEIIQVTHDWCELAYSCRNIEQFANKVGITDFNRYGSHRDVFYTAEFCLGKLTQKTVSGISWWIDTNYLYKIAKIHGDDWIRKWCTYLLLDSYHNWFFLRRFYLEGLCDRPEDDSYYMGLMNARCLNRGDDMAAYLRQNPDMLEYDIWRLFEIEGTSEISMGTSHYNTDWVKTFKELSQAGDIDRFRVLECSLQALTRDFIQFRSGWYSRFHELMEPTDSERLALKSYYLRLCASAINPTVSFALKAVVKLEKLGAFSVDELLSSLAPALNSKTKATVKKAVAILVKQLKKEPSKAEKIFLLICNAFCHEAPDVQESTLKILLKHDAFSFPAVSETILSYTDLLVPSVRAQLPKVSDEEVNEVIDIEKTLEEAAQIPQRWRQELGIDNLLANKGIGGREIKAIDWPQEIERFDFLPSDFEVILTIDDLIDCCQTYLSNPADILLLESIFEAIGRIGHDKPEDFKKRTGPLLKRCEKLLESNDYFPELASDSLLGYVSLVFACWIDENEPAKVDFGQNLHSLWNARLCEIALLAGKGQPFSLLSTPSHGLSLAPSILEDRLKKLETSELDLAFAVMRLTSIGKVERLLQNHQNASKKVIKLFELAQSPEPLISSRVKFTKNTSGNESWTSSSLELEKDERFKSLLDDLLVIKYYYFSEPFPVLNSVFPRHPELKYTAVSSYMSGFYSWVEAGSDRVLTYDQINLPTYAFNESAWLMLGNGLFSADKYLREITGDLLIDSIEDGRLGTTGLHYLLIKFCSEGFAICKRIAPALRVAAEISSLHVAVIRDAIIACMVDIKVMPRDFSALLEILRDLLVLSGASVKSEKCQDVLKSFKGSSKTAKLAKSILSLEESQKRVSFDNELLACLLETRLKRYEEWKN